MKEEIWEDSLIVFGNNVCISSLLFFLGKPGVDNNNLNVLNVFQKKKEKKNSASNLDLPKEKSLLFLTRY